MKVFVLCLLALVAFCDARPNHGHGPSQDQLEALAEKLGQELGIEVSADDVLAALENADASDVSDVSDVIDSSDVGTEDADDKLQQFADLIGEDVDEVRDAAEMLEQALGEEFDEDEVDAFLEEHGEDIIKEMLEATRGMTSEEKDALKDEIVEKVDQMLHKPRLFKAILQKLSDEGLLEDDIVSRRSFPASDAVSADVTADVSADVTADVSADVTADVSADVTADVSADVTADVSADVTADVSADVTSVVSADVTADVSVDVDDLTPEDLADIARELSDQLGVHVSPEDVLDMLETVEKKRSMNKRSNGASSSMSDFADALDDLLDDLEDDDLVALAAAVSANLGEEVTVEEVQDFMEENADTLVEIIVLAAEELTSAEFAEFEDLLNHPTLLADVMIALAEEGLIE